MGKREPIKTTISEAIAYWSSKVDECGLSVDWAESDTHCWRCGCRKNLERCHIVPDSLGGKDEPSNIVLLCNRCHIDGPNVTDPEVMWDWIRAYSVAFYDTFWNIMGMKEYEFMYHHSLQDDILDIFTAANITTDKNNLEILNVFISEAIECAGIHFGHPYLNNSTIAGIYRMAVKKLAEYHNVTFPCKTHHAQPSSLWWTKYIFGNQQP